jgi:hypothetical protein
MATKPSVAKTYIPAEKWIAHFEVLLNSNLPFNSDWVIDIDKMEVVDQLDSKISTREIVRAIKAKKGKTSPGHDGVNMQIIKKFSDQLIHPLSLIYNHILNSGVFPKEWALSIVHPLFKNSGVRTDPGNYRGISLLPCLGKVFMKIVSDRLQQWMTQNKVVSQYQAGFRKGFSTIDQAFSLSTIIERRLSKKMTTYVAFIDFKKAFDKVPRQALWWILAKNNVSKKILKLLMNMYDANRYAVRLDRDKISREFSSNVGVMQGCQASPLLFIIFIEELVKYIMKTEDGNAPCIGELECPLLLFADDVGLVSTSINGLRRLINTVDVFCNELGMELNVQKTKIVVFKKVAARLRGEHWMYRGDEIQNTHSFTYLGVTFMHNLDWSDHLSAVANKANCASIALHKFLRKVRSSKRIKLGLHLFDTMVAPIMYYGCELFGFSPLEKLDQVATRFYKTILCLPRSAGSTGVELVLGRFRMAVEIKYRIIKFWFRLVTNMNRERIPYLSYQMDRKRAEEKKDCWATKVKTLLRDLGFPGLWERQDELVPEEVKPTLRLIKQRLKDQNRLVQVSDCLGLPTTAHLPNIADEPGKVMNEFKQIKAHGLRINLARLALKCPGGMVIYSEMGKKCRACLRYLDTNAFIHRIYDCPKYSKRRKTVQKKRWFMKGKMVPHTYFLTYLLKYKKFESLTFFY